ncbi:DUF4250 domain-containing protein [Clostridium sardiniense]|uniref:DUF4250 domain-containing protein n=1 Tax=Clostridium sardiniense TaxID=29369 RepID=UPI003D32BF62
MTTEEIKEMDVNILVSVINLKLRDYYSNLDLLCEDMDIDKKVLIEALDKGEYEYKDSLNQFK